MIDSGPSINLVAVGVLFGLLQIIFLLVIISVKKKRSKLRYFSLFLTVLLVAQLESFLNRSGYMADVPHFINISTPLIFLLGPLLFLYTKAWLREGVTSREIVLHALPFLLYFGYSFFFFLQPVEYKFNTYVSSFNNTLVQIAFETSFSADPWNIQGIVVVELLSLHILIYSVYTLFRLKKFRLSYPKTNISWPVFINLLLVFGGVILLSSQGGVINGYRFFPSLIPHFSADLFPTLATYGLSIYILKNGLPLELKLPKYYKSGVDQELRSIQVSKIKNQIESQRLFTKPDFSLQLLAEACNLSTHHISQVINEEMGCTFFELTNSYRIEEAKRLLASNEYIKIEQLAYELGYRSKSTFFTAFKKSTKLTPLKYQQSQVN